MAKYRVAETLSAHVAGEMRAEMSRLGVTNRMLAEAIGKDESWLSRRLNCRYEFTLNEMEEIAAQLGMRSAELVASYFSRRDPDDDDDGGVGLKKGPISTMRVQPVRRIRIPASRAA